MPFPLPHGKGDASSWMSPLPSSSELPLPKRNCQEHRMIFIVGVPSARLLRIGPRKGTSR